MADSGKKNDEAYDFSSMDVSGPKKSVEEIGRTESGPVVDPSELSNDQWKHIAGGLVGAFPDYLVGWPVSTLARGVGRAVPPIARGVGGLARAGYGAGRAAVNGLADLVDAAAGGTYRAGAATARGLASAGRGLASAGASAARGAATDTAQAARYARDVGKSIAQATGDYLRNLKDRRLVRDVARAERTFNADGVPEPGMDGRMTDVYRAFDEARSMPPFDMQRPEMRFEAGTEPIRTADFADANTRFRRLFPLSSDQQRALDLLQGLRPGAVDAAAVHSQRQDLMNALGEPFLRARQPYSVDLGVLPEGAGVDAFLSAIPNNMPDAQVRLNEVPQVDFWGRPIEGAPPDYSVSLVDTVPRDFRPGDPIRPAEVLDRGMLGRDAAHALEKTLEAERLTEARAARDAMTAARRSVGDRRPVEPVRTEGTLDESWPSLYRRHQAANRAATRAAHPAPAPEPTRREAPRPEPPRSEEPAPAPRPPEPAPPRAPEPAPRPDAVRPVEQPRVPRAEGGGKFHGWRRLGGGLAGAVFLPPFLETVLAGGGPAENAGGTSYVRTFDPDRAARAKEESTGK